MRLIALITVVTISLASFSRASSDPLVVHEWGTFTSLQDENGRAIGGLNVDDEPLPKFVHDLLQGRSEGSLFSKGLPGGSRSEITMRLETPVMYFHLPQGSAQQTVDVSVQFRGGLLSQFYPDAKTNVGKSPVFPIINDQTLGTLQWPNVKVGTHAAGPETNSHVWLAPRKVDAADVTASSGESERYLFYRGVGHIDAPIISTQRGGQVTFRVRPNYEISESGSLAIEKLWLANFDADGSCHAVALGPLGAPGHTAISSPIPQSDSAMNLKQLRTSMKDSLVASGLFDDEAEAMLSTWEKSYFKRPGLRLFYVVPRRWTDHYLPLKLSTDAQVERVMIGRLEIVSPEQRTALLTLASMDNISTHMKQAWDLYSSLGRFKMPLMLDAQCQQPSAGLRQFINLYGLQ